MDKLKGRNSLNPFFYVSLWLLVLLIAGCRSTNVQKVVPLQVDSNEPLHLNLVYVNTTNFNNIDVALSKPSYDGDQLARGMQSAAYSSPPGADPASAILGTLLAGELMKNMEKSAQIEKKNKPVAIFLNKASSIDWKKLVSSERLKKKWIFERPKGQFIPLVTIQPHLSLSSDYRNFELDSLVTIKSQNNRVIYQNYFHIYSHPFLDKSQLLSELNNLSGEVLNANLLEILVRLEYLIDKDVLEWQKLSRENNPVIFKNDDRQYYDRGTILNKEDNYIAYRTLRGEIKYMPYQD